MRILLINPRWPAESLWDISFYRWPPFALAVVAGATPPEHRVAILDENVDDIEYSRVEADLVGITAMTPLAPRSYEIARQFRARGIPVVLGGMHPTMLPDEARSHGCSVVAGEADAQWRSVVRDAEAGSLKPVYQADSPSIADLPPPRLDLLRQRAYFTTNMVQTTRGCPFQCDFCAVSAFHHGRCRTRPVEAVVQDIQRLRGRHVFFVDDNIAANAAYAKQLFIRLAPLGKRWFSQCSLTIALDDDLLRLAADSGCRGLFIGFESVSEASLHEVHKVNLVRRYRDCVRKIQDHGIAVEGAFVFGFDNDDATAFQRTVDFCHDLQLDVAQFALLTPYPGTRLFRRLRSERRILTDDWSKYDGAHVVYQPKRLSVQELYDGFDHAYEAFYSITSILSRFFHAQLDRSLYLTINLGFRAAAKQHVRHRSEP